MSGCSVTVNAGDLMYSSFLRYAVIVAVIAVAATATSIAPLAQQPQAPSVFRSRLNLISVDVIVRDKSGAVVRNLTASDFEVREDGRSQDITNFSFEEITDKGVKPVEAADLLAGVEEKLAEESKRASSVTPAATKALEAPVPMTSDMLAGRRLITILFDVSSMQPEDVQRAVDPANKYVEQQMPPADLVAVATVGSTLSVLTDFTADRAKVASALNTIASTDGTSTATATASTAATDEAAATDDTTVADT